MKTKELLKSIVNNYEISIGCGTYKAIENAEIGKIENYFNGKLISGRIEEDKEYLYMWSEELDNPLNINPNAIIIDDHNSLIYLWKI